MVAEWSICSDSHSHCSASVPFAMSVKNVGTKVVATVIAIGGAKLAGLGCQARYREKLSAVLYCAA